MADGSVSWVLNIGIRLGILSIEHTTTDRERAR